MSEHPYHSHGRFLRRVLRHGLISLGLVIAALGLGVLGYHLSEGLPWLDSLLNAAMILGGMGPVDPVKSAGGKLFASFYALFSGLLFVGLMGIVLTPFAHRLLHTVHLEHKARDAKEAREAGDGPE